MIKVKIVELVTNTFSQNTSDTHVKLQDIIFPNSPQAEIGQFSTREKVRDHQISQVPTPNITQIPSPNTNQRQMIFQI